MRGVRWVLVLVGEWIDIVYRLFGWLSWSDDGVEVPEDARKGVAKVFQGSASVGTFDYVRAQEGNASPPGPPRARLYSHPLSFPFVHHPQPTYSQLSRKPGREKQEGGMPPKPPRGLFVVFEGLDRSGKSTQVARLVERLEQSGTKVKSCRFPGMSLSIAISPY